MKISAKTLTALYPDTKFAGIKRTLAKVDHNVQKAHQETNLAIDSMNKTWEAKLAVMSSIGKELGGFKEAKKGGFEGGILKWIGSSPEIQKSYIEKGLDPSTIIPKESSEAGSTKTVGSELGAPKKEDKEDGLLKKIASYTEKQRDEFKGNQGQRYDASIDEWIPPVEEKPDPSIGFGETQLENWLKAKPQNQDISETLGMPTLDEIKERKITNQNYLADKNLDSNQKQSVQSELDLIDNIYSNMGGVEDDEYEELFRGLV